MSSPAPQIRRALIVLLLMAHAALFAALFVRVFKGMRHAHYEVLVYALAHGQCGCLAVWAILGRTRWLLNFGALFLLICLESLMGGGSNDPDTLAILVWLPSMVMVIVPVALAIRYRAGYALVVPVDDPAPPSQLRFSIRHIMAFTVLVGVGLAIFQNADGRRSSADDPFALHYLGFFPLAAALMVLSALLLALGRWQLVALMAALLTAAVDISLYHAPHRRDSMEYALWLALVFLLSYATFFVLRLAGYRLIRAGTAP